MAGFGHSQRLLFFLFDLGEENENSSNMSLHRLKRCKMQLPVQTLIHIIATGAPHTQLRDRKGTNLGGKDSTTYVSYHSSRFDSNLFFDRPFCFSISQYLSVCSCSGNVFRRPSAQELSPEKRLISIALAASSDRRWSAPEV